MELTRFRRVFPTLERLTWLASPSCAPAATPVVEALRAALDEWIDGEISWPRRDAAAQATRQRFADLLGRVRAHDVALLQSVAHGAATVAASLPLGSRVVVGAGEYRSNLFPWLAARGNGVEVEQVPMPDGALPSSTLISAITGDTTLVTLSVVQSASGYRTDIAPVAARCAEVGARLFLDATQSAGALRLPPTVNPDYVAVHGYKWLLCPRGAAWLYVRPDRLAEVSPLAPNNKSTTQPWAELYGGPLAYAPDARKLDMSLGWPAWAGAAAALDLVGELDPNEVEEHCLGLAQLLRVEARARGRRPLSTECPSHIVSIRSPDPAAELRALDALDVRATARAGFLRFGFHAFNTADDVARTLSALEAAA